MKADWIKKLKESHQRLVKILDQVPIEEEISDGWTKKEIMAHISGWYSEGVEGIPQILKGEKPASFRMSINGYNKRSVVQRKALTLSQTRTEMIKLHQDWIKILEGLDEDQITGFYGTTLGKKQINVLWMIKMAIDHDTSHAKALEKRFNS